MAEEESDISDDSEEELEVIRHIRNYTINTALLVFHGIVWDIAASRWRSEIMCVHGDRITWNNGRHRRPVLFSNIDIEYLRLGEDSLGRLEEDEMPLLDPSRRNLSIDRLMLLELHDETPSILFCFVHWTDIVIFVNYMRGAFGINRSFLHWRRSRIHYNYLARMFQQGGY